MKSKPNLFINTRHLTDSKEDHLTEFLVALLISSKAFLKGYERLVLSRFFKKQQKLYPDHGWKDAHIVEVETQCHYDEEKRRPDVIFHLSNGKKIACEHKIEAAETGKDEEENPNQLWDYLHLPDISGLVYVRANWKPPQERVIHHAKYVKPLKCEHFLWRDFYNLIQKDKTTLGNWMKEAFEYLGYTPPVTLIGEMKGPDSSENKRNCENFVKLMGDTRSLARDLGWKYGAGSIQEHYFDKNTGADAFQVFVSAAKAERFLFRVTPNVGELATVKARLEVSCREIADKLAIPTELDINTIDRKEGKIEVIDITTNLRDIVGKNAKSVRDIERRLLAFHAPLLRSLQKEA